MGVPLNSWKALRLYLQNNDLNCDNDRDEPRCHIEDLSGMCDQSVGVYMIGMVCTIQKAET